MIISDKQKQVIEQIISVFETGKPEPNYGRVAILNDGPGGRPQISYGKFQVNESSRLLKVLAEYRVRDGKESMALEPYMQQIGHGVLHENSEFKALLKRLGNDSVMQKVQDEMFDKEYFQPAVKFCDERWLRFPLSLLVVFDSYVHSGSVPYTIRKQFGAMLPVDGGGEKEWVKQYVGARRNWLANHSMELLRRTVYRMDCFNDLIDKGNWDLLQRPINAHGVFIR